MESKTNDPGPFAKKTVLIDLLLMTAIWALSLAVVNPRGNFPSNDDWAFASVVKELVQHGEFHPTGWSSMPMVTNVLWGSLFCLVGGCSFDVLRLSTLVLALGGMMGVYWLALEFRLPRWLAWLGALGLIFNPVYYALSYTFMTDVPFTVFCIFTALFFFRNLKTGSDMDLAIAVVLAVAATLSRQLGLALPLAFGLVLFLREGFSLRVFLRATGPAMICAASLMLYQHWLTATHQLPPIYNVKTDKLLKVLHHPSWLPPILEMTTYACLPFWGLFLAPMLISVWPGLWTARRKEMGIALFFSLIGIIGLAVAFSRAGHLPLMPMTGNIFNDTGIGPQMLRDVAILHVHNLVPLPDSFWYGVTAISIAGTVIMLAIIGAEIISLARRVRPGKTPAEDVGTLFLLLASGGYMLPLLLGGYFDRYLLVILPWLAIAVANIARPYYRAGSPGKLRLSQMAAASLLVLTLLFAVGGTRDYMTWNRLRWRALNELTQVQHVNPEQIDGGFEFGGLHFFDFNYTPPADKSYWWVHDDVYVVSFGPIPGMRLVKEYDYYNWLPPHQARICVLKREKNAKEYLPPVKSGFIF